MQELKKRIETHEGMIESAKVRLGKVETSIADTKAKAQQARYNGDLERAVKFHSSLTELMTERIALGAVLKDAETEAAFTLDDLKERWAVRHAEIESVLSVHGEWLTKELEKLREAHAAYQSEKKRFESELPQWEYFNWYFKINTGKEDRCNIGIPTTAAVEAVGDFLRRLK